jgi:hypothetical protein
VRPLPGKLYEVGPHIAAMVGPKILDMISSSAPAPPSLHPHSSRRKRRCASSGRPCAIRKRSTLEKDLVPQTPDQYVPLWIKLPAEIDYLFFTDVLVSANRDETGTIVLEVSVMNRENEIIALA